MRCQQGHKLLRDRFPDPCCDLMNSDIYEKTEKGREEIATRKHQLSLKLRSLLVLVDGEKPSEKLLQEMAPFGLTAESLKQLIEEAYIRKKS